MDLWWCAGFRRMTERPGFIALPALAASVWGQGPRALSSPKDHWRRDKPFLFFLSWWCFACLSASLPSVGRAQESPLPAHTLLSRVVEALVSASNCQSCPMGSSTMASPVSSLCDSPCLASGPLLPFIIGPANQISFSLYVADKGQSFCRCFVSNKEISSRLKLKTDIYCCFMLVE